MKVFKKLISAIIIGIMLVPTTIPVSAASKNLTVKEGEYYIESAVKSGQVVNTQGNKSANGTNIILYHNDGTDACKFKLVKSGNGYVIKTKSSNYKSALDVNGGSKASGTNVQEWKVNGGDAQLWYLRDAGNGYYYIVSALGCYLDVKGGKTADKTNIQVYTSNGSNAQKFKLISASTLPTDIYLKQQGSNTCTLTSAAMMLRARKYLSGKSYSSITESSIKSTAWSGGLKWSWTYSGITVAHKSVSGISASSLKSLLDKHPEGIVLYCGKYPHAVFLTRYSGDTFYCADPYGSYSCKELKLSDSLLGKNYGSQAKVLKNVTAYWYVSKY